MGNACSSKNSKSKKSSSSEQRHRDFKGESIAKDLISNELKEDATTSREPISKIYTLKEEIGNGHFGKVRLATLKANPSKTFAVKLVEKARIQKSIHLLN